MRKLKLIGKGWEKFTGHIGVTEFKEGLSVKDEIQIHKMDVNRLSCTIGARWDDGAPSSVGEGYEAAKGTPAPTAKEQAERDNATAEAAKGPQHAYTAEELGAIADAKGIAGLREIAEPLKIKAGSIKALIEAIVKVSGGEVPAEGEQA